jgi:hypothetical protein
LLAGGWEPGGGVEYIMDGGKYYHTLLKNHLFIESGWIICHKQWRSARILVELRAKDDNINISSIKHMFRGRGSGEWKT